MTTVNALGDSVTISGRVHSIESCGTLDGPGIRFILFLQGCLMRCKYCHNRDSWDESAGYEMTVEEVMESIRYYKPYFKSGGGLTVSGGEPILQAPFVTELFKACHAEGINTCLDTNGFMREHDQSIDELLDETDLVLIDVKHLDDKQHIALTKVSNRHTLNFIRHLERKAVPFWMRHVVVPGYTDNLASAELLANYSKNLTHLKRLELLPYHDNGAFKWQQYGEIYPLTGVAPLSRKSIEPIAQLLESYQLPVVY
ncbi:pyruvate formate-lyase-activating protein [Thalassotalea sp. PLHSN55]|uniref:pyruvate formate-lyase-activating protein n=1 Tax=Thalassotalea sp. PLHSN55 TaxID=3435888 RepID=UPI003F87D0D6